MKQSGRRDLNWQAPALGQGTRTGIALADPYGLIGKWVTTAPGEWAELSPDGKKIFYASDCNSQGCTKLIVASPGGGNPEIILEKPEPFNGYPSSAFSPDGSQPRQVPETAEAWRVRDGLD